MDQTTAAANEVVREFPGLLRVYKDGRVERLLGTETTPPGTDPGTAVQSKDVTINAETGAGVRLYLPPTAAAQKLPLLIYIHGGAFCVCTPYNPAYHHHLNALSAAANVVVASVHYRLAPEHPLPAAYDDAWEVLQWVAASDPEPWLNCHADLSTVFLAGDSAGANIAHNTAMRGTTQGFGKFYGNNTKVLETIFQQNVELLSQEERKGPESSRWAQI